MRKIFLVSVLIVIVVGGGLWLNSWWFEGRYRVSTNNAYTRATVTVISAKVPGIVERVNVDNNQYVEAGDILISMDKETFEARLAGATAEVAGAEASLIRLESRQVLQDASTNASEAEVRSAQTELEKTKLDLTRAEKLKSRGYAEKQLYDHSVADVKGAEAELARTRANLVAAEAQSKVLIAEAEQLAAELKDALAEQTLAEIRLRLSDIRAPRSGVIGNKHVEPGEYIQVGTHKMALVSLDHIWVVANFKETQLADMQVGHQARVEIDAFPDVLINGEVESLSPASGAIFSLLPADNATGNFTKIVQRVPVKIILDRNNPAIKRLRPGMSVEVSVDTRSGETDSASGT